MSLKGFGTGAAVGIGLSAVFPVLAPLAVAGIVAGAGATAVTYPFRTPANTAPNAFQQREFQPVQPVHQQPQFQQRSALVR